MREKINKNIDIENILNSFHCKENINTHKILNFYILNIKKILKRNHLIFLAKESYKQFSRSKFFARSIKRLPKKKTRTRIVSTNPNTHVTLKKSEKNLYFNRTSLYTQASNKNNVSYATEYLWWYSMRFIYSVYRVT